MKDRKQSARYLIDTVNKIQKLELWIEVQSAVVESHWQDFLGLMQHTLINKLICRYNPHLFYNSNKAIQGKSYILDKLHLHLKKESCPLSMLQSYPLSSSQFRSCLIVILQSRSQRLFCCVYWFCLYLRRLFLSTKKDLK